MQDSVSSVIRLGGTVNPRSLIRQADALPTEPTRSLILIHVPGSYGKDLNKSIYQRNWVVRTLKEKLPHFFRWHCMEQIQGMCFFGLKSI